MSKILCDEPSSDASESASPAADVEVGKTVYDRAGWKAEYVGRLNGAYLVRPIYTATGWDGEAFEERADGLAVWHEVFPKPPKPVIDREIAELNAELRDRQNQLVEATRAVLNAERDNAARLKSLARYEPLKHLEAILSGEITHYVEGDYGLQIRTAQEALIYKDNYGRKDAMRMLTLKPTADGAIQWHLTQYNDGSGSSGRVIACRSYEEAVAAAREVLLNSLEAQDYQTRPHLWASALQDAERLGIELPADVVDKGRAHLLADAEKNAADLRARLAEAEAKRDAIATSAAGQSLEGKSEDGASLQTEISTVSP